MTDPGSHLETFRERVSRADEISDDDREARLTYSDELDVLQTEYGDCRHRRVLRHGTRLAEHVAYPPEELPVPVAVVCPYHGIYCRVVGDRGQDDAKG